MFKLASKVVLKTVGVGTLLAVGFGVGVSSLALYLVSDSEAGEKVRESMSGLKARMDEVKQANEQLDNLIDMMKNQGAENKVEENVAEQHYEEV